MVEVQLRGRDINDARVLAAMLAVPRHEFVPADRRSMAYADAPLPIGHQQTISQPYIVALMTQLLELDKSDTVLEIGTGSGYQAAILSHLASRVYTLERIPELAQAARRLLKKLRIENVVVIEGDGSRGCEQHAPYQAILVTAAAPRVPQPLKRQLADGGRLVLPVGGRWGQVLERWRRKGDKLVKEQLTPVAFVPLVGDHGWKSARSLFPGRK